MRDTLIISFLLILFLFTFNTQAENIDIKVREIVLESETEVMDNFMHGITHLGDKKIVWLAFLVPDNEFRKDTFKSVLFTSAITYSLKYTIGKTRPHTGVIEYKPFSGNKSMPSGHSTVAFTLATVLSEHYPRYKVAWYTLSSLVAISRIYEDEHWASDVVTGSLIGHFGTKLVLEETIFEW